MWKKVLISAIIINEVRGVIFVAGAIKLFLEANNLG
jgi:hypothetical protein